MNGGRPAAPGVAVVLGASGFIGSAVTMALARRGTEVRAVSRRGGGRFPFPRRVEVIAADVTDGPALTAAVAGADLVVDLVLQPEGWRAADRDPDASHELTVGVVRRLAEALGTPARRSAPPVLLHAGAVSQVGQPAGVPIDGTETDRPVTVYDEHKLEAERVLAGACERGLVRGATLRLPTVYGAVDGTSAVDNGVVSAMVRRALHGDPLTMWHDGHVRRDAVHVDDVASAFVTAARRIDRIGGRHWLLGSGRSRPLGDIFRIIATAVADRTGRPPAPVVTVAPPPTALVTDFHSLDIDIAPFRSRSGWHPVVELEDGIGRTVDHLLRNGTAEARAVTGAATAARPSTTQARTGRHRRGAPDGRKT